MFCMRFITFFGAAILSATGFAQSAINYADLTDSPATSERVMVLAVAHDDSVIGGGISGSNFLPPGIAGVEPIAWITADGSWVRLECRYDKPEACKKFERSYLSQPHDYSVVSGDGYGTAVHVRRMDLYHDCFGIAGRGGFSAGSIRSAAVAAETSGLFTVGGSAHRLPDSEAAPMRKALAEAVGNKLDTTKELRVYALNLDGHNLFVFQRAFQDWASKPEYAPPASPEFEMVFAFGSVIDGRLRVFYWKKNTTDDNEQILGVIHLRNGHDYLVSASSDPESNRYRVYGYRDGKLVIVFEGGGGSC